MSENSFSIGHDGTRYVLTSNVDGTIRTARLAAGSHTDQEHDAAILQMRQAYSGLRQWAIDAQDAFTTWPTKTAAQKDATQREVIRRFGVLSDRLADLLLTLNADA